VIQLCWYVRWPDLDRTGIATGGHVLLALVGDGLITLGIQFRMMLGQPQVVVGVIHAKVIGQLHVLEASMWA